MAKGEAARRHVDWGIDSFLLDRANTKSAQDMQEIDRRESAIKSVSPSARLLKMQDRLSRSQLASRPWWVVHPLDQAWTQYWDLLVMGALVTVLFLTPYEVAFVDALDLSDPSLCVLFAFNRVIDAIFCLDMALSFHLAYPLEDGRQWVVKPVEIRRNYLRSWFGLDALSIFPFWVVPLLAARDEHGGQALDFLPVVRIIRLFRLIKLARVLGASRLFKRYEMEQSWSYAQLSLAKTFLLVFVWAHLQACIWGIMPQFEAAEASTWLDALADSRGVPLADLSSWQKYAAANYWSMMTLTSIGYGAMLPPDDNENEQLVCSTCMFFSSLIWVYSMGQICAIASTMDPETTQFHNTLDSINHLMRLRRLRPGLQRELRVYFHSSRRMRRLEGDAGLLEQMSPQLRGRVALETHFDWLQRVWWLRLAGPHRIPLGRDEHRSFIAHIAMVIEGFAFVSSETLPCGVLYILRRGLVCQKWHFRGPGRVWGEDVLLYESHPELIESAPCTALTYVEVSTLHWLAIKEGLRVFPAIAARLRAAAARITMARLVIRFAKDISRARRDSLLRQSKRASSRASLVARDVGAEGARVHAGGGEARGPDEALLSAVRLEISEALSSAESAKLATQAGGWARLRAIVAAESAQRSDPHQRSISFASDGSSPRDRSSFSPCLSGMSFKGRPMGGHSSPSSSSQPRTRPPRGEVKLGAQPHLVLQAVGELEA